MLSEVLTDYPDLGFSPPELMLFNPLNQSPIRTVNPDQSGAFSIENVGEGTYILDAELDGFGCSGPLLVNLTSDTSVDTLRLYPEEQISGIITEAVWESGKVCRIVGDIIVPDNVTLTIEPDVLITLAGDYSITVSGGIQIAGSPSHPVHFRPELDHYLSGGDWGGIRLEIPTGDCSLNGAAIQGAFTSLRVSDGAAQVSQCLFDTPGAHGVYFLGNSAGEVTHCIFRDGSNGLEADDCSPEFSFNVILRMDQTGISILSGADPVVVHNAILDCSKGIWSNLNNSPEIEYNLISGGNLAIEAAEGLWGTIRYNQIQMQNQEGVYFWVGKCYPLFEYNNFAEMPQIILRVTGWAGFQADTLYAPFNYWDGESGSNIPLRIIDGSETGTPGNPVGPVVFEPAVVNPWQEIGP